MGAKGKLLPLSGHVTVKNLPTYFDSFFLVKRISTNNETFDNVSPFLVQRAISATVGDVTSIKKIRSGDLLVEVNSMKQAKQIMKIKALADIKITVEPHKTLNSSKGVITVKELFNVPLEEIACELKPQGVTHARRIFIRRDGHLLPTKHLILTFRSPKLPVSIKAGYINCPVRPYIPTPLRCFHCQRFGHTKTACRGKLTCARCAEVGHDNAECNATEKCVNCKGNHTSYSRSCPIWKFEKEVIEVKFKEQMSYPEARRIVKARTTTSGNTYASAVKKTLVSQSTQYEINDFPPDIDTDTSDTVNSETVKAQRKKPSKAEKSLKLKISKHGFPRKDLAKTFKKQSKKQSLALGIAEKGLIHKDLPSLFGGTPKSSDVINLHPSEEEDEDLKMSCEVSPTPNVSVSNSFSPQIT
ncbi:uncharacterized protein LOC129959845 [Argiope bruennichi]|uniref:uncharacterized protein LOC129959845 n=1 Tax=Argiope bruennichi TaxID=94029 RepID=UPI0024958771|nr:uncharacterized protein LOC129959845 [Argiope bruennichi]